MNPNFPMFSHNSGQHSSRTLAFELFQFWLRIRVDIRNRKSLPVSVSRGVDHSPHRRVGESPTPRIGESRSRLFEQILGPLKQRHHQRQKIFNNIFFQCIVLDYMHVFARYSLKWTFRKY
jgi:hypothetical protein